MKKYLFRGIVIMIAVVILYGISLQFSLFYIFWWFDWALHLIGGVGLGYLGYVLGNGHKVTLLTFTASIAVAWEVFERIGYQFAPTWIMFGALGDTLIDIACAILGAYFIIIINDTY